MNLPANVLDYAIDALAIVAVTVLVALKVVDREVWMLVVLPIVGARTALRKPPGGGEGGSPPTTGAIVALLGSMGLVNKHG